jgi:hypothetical protein
MIYVLAMVSHDVHFVFIAQNNQALIQGSIRSQLFGLPLAIERPPRILFFWILRHLLKLVMFSVIFEWVQVFLERNIFLKLL